MRVTSQIIKQTIIIIIRTIKMIQMIPTKLTELFIFIGTPYVCYVPSELYRISYQRQTCTPLPLLSKLLPWAWVNVFFVFHDFHSHLDNSYHNRHDLSTIIIIILHHHDLKSIISFKQTRLFWRHIKTPCQLVNNASSSPTFFIIMEYVLSYHNAHLTFPLMIIISKPRGFSRKHSVLSSSDTNSCFCDYFMKYKLVYLVPKFLSQYKTLEV